MHECYSRSIAGAENSKSKAQAERVMPAAGYEVVQ
jgi:hypothetical protein